MDKTTLVYLIFKAAVIIFISISLIWLLSIIIKNMSIVDIYWGTGFIAVCVNIMLGLNTIEPRQFLVTYLIFLWGARLAVHVFVRNHKLGENHRYKQWRSKWGRNTWWISYFRVFLLQGLLMLILCMPLLSIMHNAGEALSLNDIAGIILWIIGWIIESIADYQLYRFKSKPENRDKIMESGLWRYSRHPNYFGETLVWWGIFSISISSGYWCVSLASPLLITFMQLKASGFAGKDTEHEHNDKYADYKSRTSMFFLLPPKKGL